MINKQIKTDACDFVRTIKRYERKIQRLTKERDSYKESYIKIANILKAWRLIKTEFYERYYDHRPY